MPGISDRLHAILCLAWFRTKRMRPRNDTWTIEELTSLGKELGKGVRGLEAELDEAAANKMYVFKLDKSYQLMPSAKVEFSRYTD